MLKESSWGVKGLFGKVDVVSIDVQTEFWGKKNSRFIFLSLYSYGAKGSLDFYTKKAKANYQKISFSYLVSGHNGD